MSQPEITHNAPKRMNLTGYAAVFVSMGERIYEVVSAPSEAFIMQDGNVTISSRRHGSTTTTRPKSRYWFIAVDYKGQSTTLRF